MGKFWTFIFAEIVSFIPGFIGVLFTPHGESNIWYNELSKSVLTPAGWVFGVAWTILYALLGIALYLVIVNKDKKRPSKSNAYWLFFGQMALNLLWSYVFFGLHMAAMALLVLVFLIVVSIYMARAFRPFSKAAYYLVWPYIIWMCFATYLNTTIMIMN